MTLMLLAAVSVKLALPPAVLLIAALTVMYIVLGTALDGISMIVLTTAVVIPMIKAAGIACVPGKVSPIQPNSWPRLLRIGTSKVERV